EPGLDARLEAATLLALVVVEREQSLTLVVGQRPAVGAARDGGQDRLRAGARGRVLLRIATEDALAACGVAGARDVERAFDDDLVELGDADVHAGVVLLALERLQNFLPRGGALLREGDADVVAAGGDVHDDLEAAVDLVRGLA